MASDSEKDPTNNTPSLPDTIYRAALNSVASTLLNSLDIMNTFNQNRLFWVWGSGMLSTVLDLIPSDGIDALNLQNATDMLDSLAPHTGRLSFILYFIRLLFNIALVFALAQQAYDKEQQDISNENKKKDYFQHLWIQLKDKKFDLINDIFWAPGNMACFLWLTTKAGLGFWGDILTVMLLTIDTIIATLEYLDQAAKHKELMLWYDEEIAKEDRHSSKYLELCAEQAQATKAWEEKQVDLIRNILYALSLLIAFALIVAGSVFPPLSTAGTFVCFTLTISHNFTNAGIGIYNAYCAKEEAQKALANTTSISEYNDLYKKATYQDELFVIKTLQLFPVVIPQLLIPPLVFAAFMITPAGAGFAAVVSVLVVTAVLATAAAFILKKYEPKKLEEPQEPEEPEVPKSSGNQNLFFAVGNEENEPFIPYYAENVSHIDLKV